MFLVFILSLQVLERQCLVSKQLSLYTKMVALDLQSCFFTKEMVPENQVESGRNSYK